jgi:hypothetical protein
MQHTRTRIERNHGAYAGLTRAQAVCSARLGRLLLTLGLLAQAVGLQPTLASISPAEGTLRQLGPVGP